MKPSTPEITVRGRVTWLYHSSRDFSAGVLTTDDHRQVRFRGCCQVQCDEAVAMTGHLVRHRVYGEQLDARLITYDLAVEPAGLARYLAHTPAFRGIGPAKARRLAEAFGTDFDRVVREEPARLRAVVSLGDEALAAFCREWVLRSETNALASWLAAHGLTHYQLTKIAECFGAQARTVLLEDPYRMAEALDGFGFTRCDAVALKMGMPKDHPGRVDAALVDCLQRAADDGHCWIDHRALVSRALHLLTLDDLDAADRVHTRVATLVSRGMAVTETDGTTTRVALPTLYQQEHDLHDWLWRYGRRRAKGAISEHSIDAYCERSGTPLTSRQREAVVMAARSVISLIVGAAGSGKSHTVAALADLCESAGHSVVLCAPTGKAAMRLEGLTGMRARTIHRLLGYDGSAWEYGSACPLDADVIIVDEAGMVDVGLAWHLFAAVDFRRTRLVLVGDHQQLPPVGAGNLMRDLLQRHYTPICTLDQVHRHAGLLREHAQAILQGQLAPTAPGVPGVARPWYVIDTLKDPDAVVAALLGLLQTKLPTLGFDPVRDVQVITPYRKGPLGTNRLNAEVQRLIQRERHGVDLPPVQEDTRVTFHPGDKVMQTRNNYTLGVMNGTIGTVDAITTVPTDGGTQRVYLVTFDGRTVQIPVGSDMADQLALAYVTTIHKSQGSEFPCVIAILHRQHAYMLHRNLVYTAVTRAQQTAILLGDRSGMARAVQTASVDARRTWLSVWGRPRTNTPTPLEVPHV